MKIVYEYSHLGGSEILHVRYPQYEREIYEVVEAVIPRRLKISRERPCLVENSTLQAT